MFKIKYREHPCNAIFDAPTAQRVRRRYRHSAVIRRNTLRGVCAKPKARVDLAYPRIMTERIRESFHSLADRASRPGRGLEIPRKCWPRVETASIGNDHDIHDHIVGRDCSSRRPMNIRNDPISVISCGRRLRKMKAL